MKVITESITKVVLEVTLNEIEKIGFDQLWSKVRNVYPKHEYEVFSIENKPNEKNLFYIELISNSLLE